MYLIGNDNLLLKQLKIYKQLENRKIHNIVIVPLIFVCNLL